MPRTKKTDIIKSTSTKTKAIAESYPAVGAIKNANSVDIQGREATANSLSPRQAYQLSIPFHRSVEVIVEQICKADWFLFTESGDKITSGDVFDFCRTNITKQFIRECISNWLIEGEMMSLKPFSYVGDVIRPEGLLVLDSGFAYPFPPQAASLEFVREWQYTAGRQILPNTPVIMIPADQLMFVKNFNPTGSNYQRIRGLSPAIVGCQHINGSYFSARYNAAYFQNGAKSDIVLKFPKNTNKEEAQAVADQWSQRHSIFGNKSFKISAVIGDEFEIIDPSTNAKEGNFLQLAEYDDASVYSLMGIPPVISQDFTRATQDSADTQYESFYENTLIPPIEVFNDFIQTQLIEPHFIGGSVNTKKVPTKLSKYLKKSLDSYQGADIVFRIDPETLPVANKLRSIKIDVMNKTRQAMALTYKEAAEMCNLDRPSNAADNVIAIANTDQLVPLTGPAQDIKPTVYVEPESEGLSTEDEQPDRDDTNKSLQIKELKKLVIKYRAEIIRQASTGTLNKKALIDITKVNPTMLLQLHQDYLTLKELFKDAEIDKVIECKKYLNTTYSNANLKLLA